MTQTFAANHKLAPFSGKRPFLILGLQQVALGSTDKSKLKRLWVDMLGLEVSSKFQSEKENVLEEICRLGFGTATVEIDLMQPLDPAKKPAVHEPALNHIGLWVDDLKAAFEWLSDRGVRFAPGGIRVGASGHEICFIHPKGNEQFPLGGEGVLIELVQAPDELIAKLKFE
jgi:lactoylglutathione lyase